MKPLQHAKNSANTEKVICPHCGGNKVMIAVLPKDNKLCPCCFGEGEIRASRIKIDREKVTISPSKGYAV